MPPHRFEKGNLHSSIPIHGARVRRPDLLPQETIIPSDVQIEELSQYIDTLTSAASDVLARMRNANQPRLSEMIGLYMEVINKGAWLGIRIKGKSLPSAKLGVADSSTIDAHITLLCQNLTYGVNQVTYVWNYAMKSNKSPISSYCVKVHNKGVALNWVKGMRRLLVANLNTIDHLARAIMHRGGLEEGDLAVIVYREFVADEHQ